MNNDFTISYFAQLADIDGSRTLFKINLKLIEIRNLIKSDI